MNDDLYTAAHIQAIVEDAGKTAIMSYVSGVWPAGYSSFWPDIVQNANEAYGYNAPERVRIQPNMKQMSELEKVEGWLVDMASYCRDKKIPWVARTVQYYMLVCPYTDRKLWSLRRIAREKFNDESPSTIKSWYQQGIEIITNQRNSKLVEGRKFLIGQNLSI